MATRNAGNLWLKAHFGLNKIRVKRRSYIGSRSRLDIGADHAVEQTFGSKYAPPDGVFDHMAFALRYDDLDLDLLAAVFRRMPEADLLEWISLLPGGKYTRKIGFLYEWLTGRMLDFTPNIRGNYIDLLDADRYYTGTPVKNSRWRVNDNLLGTPDFCPIVRRTHALDELLGTPMAHKLEELKASFEPAIFTRATHYLYRKETKSSFGIEQEVPSPDRMERFVAILHQAGRKPLAEVLKEAGLVSLQNAIVDPRYAQTGFRDFQNFVGQTNYRGDEIYHYICPPPDMVRPLMNGLAAAGLKSMGAPALVRAALISFGFVFIHPFEDGNGRIHRFLIHDMLVRDGFIGNDLIIPVSAQMLNKRRDYDEALEDYSKAVMERLEYTAGTGSQLAITNVDEVRTCYRYPDLTVQATYLARAIHAAIYQDLAEELYYLERYDELKRELQNLIDMPNRRMDDLILFLHQNKGHFPNRKKPRFPEITQQEFEQIEAIYAEVFSHPPDYVN